ncbi:MAG: sugar-binding domain-containing protein [Ignavibacteriales bacterium]
MKYKNIIIAVICVITLTNFLSGQIRIKELPKYDLTHQDSLFFNVTNTRNIINLDGRWSVYTQNNKEDKNTVSVPSNFRGEEELTFEREIRLDQQQVGSHRFQLIFLGVNYSAEIILNNFVIYKHPGGDFPFKVELPRDILKTDRKNVLAVRVTHKLSSESTLPVNQRFLFPESVGGIFRDVYLQSAPLSMISSSDYSYSISGNNRITLNINSRIEGRPSDEKTDSTARSNEYSFRVRLISPSGEDVLAASPTGFVLNSRKDKTINLSYDISNVTLWSPQAPHSYKLRYQLLRGDQIVDDVIKSVAFYSLVPSKEVLLLNNEPFILNGTTYYSSFPGYGNLASYDRLRSDMRAIKSMGFNAVRFPGAAPHPYCLRLCEEMGLLAFIELPVGSIPEQITDKASFRDRIKSYLTQFINGYKDYSAVAAIGLGSSYLPASPSHISFLTSMADFTKHLSNKLTYASFAGFDISPIEKLDFYGVQLLNKPMSDYTSRYENLEAQMGKGRVFISSATYATFMGSTNGYSNPFSFEAQAKFFSDLLDYTTERHTSGYFINSMFDYQGDYASFSTGYSPIDLYRVGIYQDDHQTGRLAQKVIYAKLHNDEQVTIPQGAAKDDSPIIFIIYGVGLALIMGALVNAKRKFREDATRALLRPYNFYADIRDMRLMSGVQSSILMVVLSLCSALLQVNLLYFFRTNILLEKIILALGTPGLSKFIAYLAWNPTQALLWMTIASLVFFIMASIIIKIASFFVRNKVFFSSIYFMVIWSFLPLLLLLPLGLILYKVLNANVMTIYLFICLMIFTIWIFYRLMKGIYVIFDVNPAHVYFYSLGLLLLIIGGILIYFQLSESSIYYIINAYRQYKLM